MQKSSDFCDKQNTDTFVVLELNLNNMIMHEVELVVCAYRLPAERRRRILGQRGGTPLPDFDTH